MLLDEILLAFLILAEFNFDLFLLKKLCLDSIYVLFCFSIGFMELIGSWKPVPEFELDS